MEPYPPSWINHLEMQSTFLSELNYRIDLFCAEIKDYLIWNFERKIWNDVKKWKDVLIMWNVVLEDDVEIWSWSVLENVHIKRWTKVWMCSRIVNSNIWAYSLVNWEITNCNISNNVIVWHKSFLYNLFIWEYVKIWNFVNAWNLWNIINYIWKNTFVWAKALIDWVDVWEECFVSGGVCLQQSINDKVFVANRNWRRIIREQLNIMLGKNLADIL